MREALSALTNRGRAFIAAGTATLLCAVVLGYGPLIAVGALLLLVPLAAAFFVGRGRYSIRLTRSLSPSQVTVATLAQVRLDLGNATGTPTGQLLLEEQLPYVLGSRPRFVVDRLGGSPDGAAGGNRRIEYAVRSDLRGKFTIGPLSVRLADPFGMVELDRRFTSTSTLVVTPRVVALPTVTLNGVWTGAGDNRPRAFASGSAEDVTVRDYRQGDELRRVHWRSSAKRGELMVRREEQPWQARATVLIDNRDCAHVGAGAASSLEYAVEAAASITSHLIRRGYHVRLVTASGDTGTLWHDQGSKVAETGTILEALAVLELDPNQRLDVRWLGDNSPGLVVGVFGALTAGDRSALTRVRHAATAGMAVVLDTATWPVVALQPDSAQSDPARIQRNGSGTSPTIAILTGAGFRTTSAGPNDPLPQVWQRLAETTAARQGAS